MLDIGIALRRIICRPHPPFGHLPPQKHSRLTRLKRFVILLVSSSHPLEALRDTPCFLISPSRFIAHRARVGGSTPFLERAKEEAHCCLTAHPVGAIINRPPSRMSGGHLCRRQRPNGASLLHLISHGLNPYCRDSCLACRLGRRFCLRQRSSLKTRAPQGEGLFFTLP